MFFPVATNDATRPWFCITLMILKPFFDNVALQKLAVVLAEFLKDAGKMEREGCIFVPYFWV